MGMSAPARRAGTSPTYPAAAPRPDPGAGAEHPRRSFGVSVNRKSDARGAGRGCDHPVHRQHAFRLPAPRLFGFWIVANLDWVPGVPAWDPSFVVLAMAASVEAIFLSTFVLISQNRMAADKRADLDLQVSLLAEHEVTRLRHAGVGDR